MVTSIKRIVLNLLPVIGIALCLRGLYENSTGQRPLVSLLSASGVQSKLSNNVGLFSIDETYTPRAVPDIDESIDDFVDTMLSSTSPLLDINTAGNPWASSVTLLDRKLSYEIGDTLRLRVDIRDGNGRQLDRGGDDIRVTLEGDDAFMAGHVDDLLNGSYAVELPLLWSGAVAVKVRLQKTFERYRAYYFTREITKTVMPLDGEFDNGNEKERTFCSSFPRLKIYKNLSVCDYTEQNDGLDWFCVKPRSDNLNCGDLVRLYDKQRWPMNLTSAEQDLVNRGNVLIPSCINIYVRSNSSSIKVPDTPHTHTKASVIRNSWLGNAPRGYFINHIWHTRYVEDKIIEQTQLLRALQNTTLLFLGDSNARIMFELMSLKTGCTEPDGTPVAVGEKIHVPMYCVRRDYGFKMNWTIHGLPVHFGVNGIGFGVDEFRASHVIIDKIPSTGKFVVVIHFWIHFFFSHHSVFTKHLTSVRDAVERALQRNPDVVFVIRGPHMVITSVDGDEGEDTAARLFDAITRKLFRRLYDKVVYFQPWDITVAVNNQKRHPNPWVQEVIVDVLVSYINSQLSES